jgi:hypothetical protein
MGRKMSVAPAFGFLLCCSVALISLGGQWTSVTLDLALSSAEISGHARHRNATSSMLASMTTTLSSVTMSEPSNSSTDDDFDEKPSSRVKSSERLGGILFQPRLWYSLVRAGSLLLGLVLVACPRRSFIVIYAASSALFAVFGVSLKFIEDWFVQGVPIFLGLTSASGAVALAGIFAMVPGEFSSRSAVQDTFLGFLTFSLKAGTDWLLWGVTHLKTDVMPSTSPSTPTPSAVETVSISEVTFLPCLANVPVAAVAAFVWFLERNKPSTPSNR